MKKYLKIGRYQDQNVAVDLERSTNQHIALVGKSGAGKSVAGQKIIKNLIDAGGTVIVFDMHALFAPENIFPEIAESLRASTCDLDAYSGGIGIKLFSPLTYPNGQEEDDSDIATAVAGIFSGALNLKCRQKEELYRAVKFMVDRKLYAEQGIAAMEDALTLINSEVAANVQDKLRKIICHNVFRDADSLITPNKVNVVRLTMYDFSTQVLIAEILLNYLWRVANCGIFRETGLFIFCDECQNLNFGKSGVLRAMLSEGRKLGLNLILITQSIGGGTRSGIAQSLLQTGVQLYFEPSGCEAVDIAKLVGGARYRDWQIILKTLSVGECVAVGALTINDSPICRPLRICT